MKRAKKLLRASKIILDRYNQKESFQLKLVSYIYVILIIIYTIKSTMVEKVNLKEAMQIQFAVVQISIAIIAVSPGICIYTGFTEDTRVYCKNSFRQLAIQLPVSKYDFMKAQFMDSMIGFSSSIIAMCFMLITNIVFERSEEICTYVGLGVVFFFIILVIQGIERGISNAIVVNMTIKYCFYVGILLVVGLVVLSTKRQEINVMLMLEKKTMWLVYLCRRLDGVWGGLTLALGIAINYVCTFKIPYLINKLRGLKYEKL